MIRRTPITVWRRPRSGQGLRPGTLPASWPAGAGAWPDHAPRDARTRLADAERRAHAPRRVAGLHADEPVDAAAAEAYLEGEVLARAHVGRDGAAVARRPEDHQVVRVLAEVVDVEAHGAARDR